MALCALHHRLWDHGAITVREEGRSRKLHARSVREARRSCSTAAGQPAVLPRPRTPPLASCPGIPGAGVIAGELFDRAGRRPLSRSASPCRAAAICCSEYSGSVRRPTLNASWRSRSSSTSSAPGSSWIQLGFGPHELPGGCARGRALICGLEPALGFGSYAPRAHLILAGRRSQPPPVRGPSPLRRFPRARQP